MVDITQWCHPYLQQPKLVQYCRSKGIVVMAYGSLGRPGDSGKSMPVALKDPVIASITAKHSATSYISTGELVNVYGVAT